LVLILDRNGFAATPVARGQSIVILRAYIIGNKLAASERNRQRKTLDFPAFGA